MTNQEINDIEIINKQIEKLQAQKHSLQRKLQEERDHTMIENHMFSQAEVQTLIQKFEKDLPEFKIDLDYKGDILTIRHQDKKLYQFPKSPDEFTTKNLLNALQTQLQLAPIHQVLLQSQLTAIKSSIRHEQQSISAIDTTNKISISLNMDRNLNIITLIFHKYLSSGEASATFDLKKYGIELTIEAGTHYESRTNRDESDDFSIAIQHLVSDIDLKDLHTEIQKGINHLTHLDDITDYY